MGYVMRLAAGDAEKLMKLREICSRFTSFEALNQEALAVARHATMPELERMVGGGAESIEILLWAMEEVGSADPEQRRRWGVYQLRHQVTPLQMWRL